MKEIEVFIAGSKTLTQLRDSARAALMEISNQYRSLNSMFRSYTFEDFPRSFTVDGRQADYNDYISNKADYVIFIFDEGFGDITLHELDVAMQSLKKNNRPQIYVYCNEAKMNCEKFKEIQRKLNDYGQYYIAYEDGHFKEQLKSDFTYVLVNSCNIISKEKDRRSEGSVSISEKAKPIVQDCFQSRKKSDGTITFKVGDIQFNMIRVEGGTLEIGATKEQLPDAEGNEYPAHRITLPTYYIGQFPVTQNLWEKVMGYNKSYFRDKKKSVTQIIQHMASDATTSGKGYVLSEMALNYAEKGFSGTVIDAISSYSRGIFSSSDKGHYPAENLSYDEAQEFVRRLSEITNLKFDLPTEDEWEYAARGGQKTLNFKYAGSNNIDDVAWYNENSGRSTHPVGEKQPNELGIFDMCGNVWEWTKTPSHSYGVDIKPEGNMFIRRGGSWWHSSKNCRVSNRYSSRISQKTSGLGLRVVIRENVE